MLALSHIRNCRPTDNPVQFTPLFLLTLEGFDSVDPEVPIRSLYSNEFGESEFTWILVFIELAYAIDIPDELIIGERAIRQIADEISKLPRLDREAYDKILLQAQMLLRAAMEN